MYSYGVPMCPVPGNIGTCDTFRANLSTAKEHKIKNQDDIDVIGHILITIVDSTNVPHLPLVMKSEVLSWFANIWIGCLWLVFVEHNEENSQRVSSGYASPGQESSRGRLNLDSMLDPAQHTVSAPQHKPYPVQGPVDLFSSVKSCWWNYVSLWSYTWTSFVKSSRWT